MQQTKTAGDGYYHGRITAILAVLSLSGALPVSILLRDPLYMLFPLGVVFGLICDPDLDLIAITGAEMRLLKLPLIGWLVGSVWVGIWAGYAMVFKHRGISHTPLLGTLTRIGWLLPYYALLHHLTGLTITIEPAIMVTCGLILSDLGHVSRDYLVSRQRRAQRSASAVAR